MHQSHQGVVRIGDEIKLEQAPQAEANALMQLRFNEELLDIHDTDQTEKNDSLKKMVTNRQSYLCRKVILACGLLHFPRKLPVLDALESQQTHYKVPRIADYSGQRVAIVGGGDSALDAAVMVLERHGQMDLIVCQDTSGKADTLKRIRDSLGRIHMATEITSPFWLNERRLQDQKINLIGDKLSEAARVRKSS